MSMPDNPLPRETVAPCKLILSFGGQGMNPWKELRACFANSSNAREIIHLAASQLAQDAKDAGEIANDCPFDLPKLLVEEEAKLPADSVWVRPHISFPIIGLTQLCQFAAAVDSQGQLASEPSPPVLRLTAHDSMAAAIGHSQGVVAAVVIASSWKPTFSEDQSASTGAQTVPLPGHYTWDAAAFRECTLQAVRLLFWQGFRITEAYDTVLRDIGAAAHKSSRGTSPMLAVTGLSRNELEKVIKGTNGRLQAGRLAVPGSAPNVPQAPGLQISLINGHNMFVVSGVPADLKPLESSLSSLSCPAGEDQSRIPFSKRKPLISTRFLNVGAPYHSHILEPAFRESLSDVKRLMLRFPRTNLAFPVLSTEDGRDLRTLPADDLADELVRLQCTALADYLATCRALTSGIVPNGEHAGAIVVDFGPGGGSGIIRLLERQLSCNGVVFACADAAYLESVKEKKFDVQQVEGLYDMSLLLTNDAGSIARVLMQHPNYSKLFRPRVCGSGLSTRFTLCTGRPPVMVAGMTPTTSMYGIELVAACSNAGYFAELAAGGLPRPAIFRERVLRLHRKLSAGSGIVLNMLFLNAKQWSFQFNMLEKLVKEDGVFIEGLTVAAGVPSVDKAAEIVRHVHSLGTRFVSFKPGSFESIMRVCQIARRVSPFPIILQWTGGRAGGHHSFEDIVAPLFDAYSACRREQNLILVAGGGIGDGASASKWLSGDWAVSTRHGAMSLRPLPVDGVLVASRMMVALEAATSPEVRQLIALTPGIREEDEHQWEESYEGEAGGVLTVRSELGEPIHKIANRCTRLWRRLDRTVFAVVDRKEREKLIQTQREDLIAAINADFQKLYFPCQMKSLHGGAAMKAAKPTLESAGMMTYGEVAARMCELMYIGPEADACPLNTSVAAGPCVEEQTEYGRWIDHTFQQRVVRFLRRAKGTLRKYAEGIARVGEAAPTEAQIQAFYVLVNLQHENILVSDPPCSWVADGTTSVQIQNWMLRPGARKLAQDGKEREIAPWIRDDPRETVSLLFELDPIFSLGARILLTASDYEAWLRDCQFGGKPVPFIPVLDADLENWYVYVENAVVLHYLVASSARCRFKKDSLWYSEDIAAVPERDAQRVAILQGPVAAFHSKTTGQSACEILSSILTESAQLCGSCQDVIRKVPPREETTTPEVRQISLPLNLFHAPPQDSDDSPVVQPYICVMLDALWDAFPSETVKLVSSLFLNPLLAFTCSDAAWRVGSNPFYGILARSKSDRTFIVERSVLGTTKMQLRCQDIVLVDAECKLDGKVLARLHNVTLPQTAESGEGELELALSVHSQSNLLAVEEKPWMAAIANLYGTLWIPRLPSTQLASNLDKCFDSQMVLDSAMVQSFCSATNFAFADRSYAQLPFTVVPAWHSLAEALVSAGGFFDLFSLVHLSHSVARVDYTVPDEISAVLYPHKWAESLRTAASPLCVGECVRTRLFITAIIPTDAGYKMVVEGGMFRTSSQQSVNETEWIAHSRIKSSFLFRGKKSPTNTRLFRKTPPEGKIFIVKINSKEQLGLLKRQPWLDLDVECLQVGDIVKFVVHVHEEIDPTFSDNSKPHLLGVTVQGTARVLYSPRRTETVATPGPGGEDGQDPAAADMSDDKESSIWTSTTGFSYEEPLTATATTLPLAMRRGGLQSGSSDSLQSLVAPFQDDAFKELPHAPLAPVFISSSRLVFAKSKIPSASGTPKATPIPDRPDFSFEQLPEADGASTHQGSVEVGTITYTWNMTSSAAEAQVTANPVVSFLEELTRPPATPDLVNDGGESPLLDTPDVIVAPTDSRPYAEASGDLNPIHTHEVLAAFAGLPSSIVHGMWSAANAYRVLTNYLISQFAAEESGKDAEADAGLQRFETEFVGMVLPGDTLCTQIHSAGRDAAGRRLYKVKTVAFRHDHAPTTVVIASAAVQNSATAFLFTGQGSASVGMGMDLYEKSTIARKVWDVADKHMLETYGFSILHVVRNNPKTLTVRFGGKKGMKIRRNYMALEVEAPDGEGVLPLLPNITEESESYTFMHPDGLLYATQFTQPALVLTEKAAFDDMRGHSVIPTPCIFAGHSLGEYAGLASVVPLLPVQALVSLVFLRGMVMQGAVPRNAQGRSEFGMVACNPSRVPGLNEDVLQQLVAAISKHSRLLLEVVNYNVADRQYVVAGHLRSLDILSNTLNIARKEPAAAADPASLLKRAFALTESKASKTGAAGLSLERGEATIPLPGIDVPFHSRYLIGGVPGFRNVLRKSLPLQAFEQPGVLGSLVGSYIPNLVAMPFSLDKSFVQKVLDETGSPVLKIVLTNENSWAKALQNPCVLARSLVIELLAYQFASPVQWISTQHFLLSGEIQPIKTTSPSVSPAAFSGEIVPFSPCFAGRTPAKREGVGCPFRWRGVREIVEIGPAMTLATMAVRTLEGSRYGSFANDRATNLVNGRKILFYGKDVDVLYDVVDPAVAASKKSALQYAMDLTRAIDADTSPQVAEPPASDMGTKVGPATLPPPRAVPQEFDSKPALPTVSIPWNPLQVIRSIVCLKLQQEIRKIDPTQSLKALCGGNSAVLNEIAGELEKEFGSIDGRAAELPLRELASQVPKSYLGPGPVVRTLMTRCFNAKLPGGFPPSKFLKHVEDLLGCSNGTAQVVALHAVVAAPQKRLSNDAEVTSWVQRASKELQEHFGVSLSERAITTTPPPTTNAVASASRALPRSPAVQDQPLDAIYAIRCICAVKLSMALEKIERNASLKTLAAGKSAVMNEIAGEIEKELGGMPDGAADMPLEEVASRNKSYTGPGKVTAALIVKHLQDRLPGGYSAGDVRKYIRDAFFFGPQRTESLLLFACVEDRSMKKLNRLSGPADVQSWLSGYVQRHSTSAGLPPPTTHETVQSMEAGPSLTYMAETPMNSAAYHRLLRLAEETTGAYQRFAGLDGQAVFRDVESLSSQLLAANSTLVLWRQEHGTAYESGIQPAFDPKKQRSYSSSWAWAVQALLELLHCDVFPSQVGSKRPAKLTLRSLDVAVARGRSTQATVRLLEGADKLLSNFISGISTPLLRSLFTKEGSSLPKYVTIFAPLQPRTIITDDGRIEYQQVPRGTDHTSYSYVTEVAGLASRSFLSDIVGDGPAEGEPDSVSANNPLIFIRDNGTQSMDANIDIHGTRELFRALAELTCPVPAELDLSGGAIDTVGLYVHQLEAKGVTYRGKTALVTGCGKGSIGAEIVKALLMGGATVLVTTSRFSQQSLRILQKIYQDYGTIGSSLLVLPFNAASAADTEGLVSHIYDKLNIDLDYFCPFGAISEVGDTVESISGKNELAHRAMMTNVVRMVGLIAKAKRLRGIATRPCLVVLPLSPNHGLFGNDGLYSESKLGLEALLNKALSEPWGEYILLSGAVIGWTRGTGLMAANNIVAEGIENLGCRTFMQEEMALNIMALLSPRMIRAATRHPIVADFTGGFARVPDFNGVTKKIRGDLTERAASLKAASQNNVAARADPRSKENADVCGFVGNLVSFPPLPSQSRRRQLAPLPAIYPDSCFDMVDLDSVVVATGYGEVCPWGNARTRWDMEASGELSLEGCILLAWLTGRIRPLEKGSPHEESGACWQDAKSGEPVQSPDVKRLFEAELLQHSGIRIIEPEGLQGYDPNRKLFFHAIALDRDMDWMEVSNLAEVEDFRRQLGDEHVDVRVVPRERKAGADNESWREFAGTHASLETKGDLVIQMRVRKGAVISVPKAMRFDRWVAGQLPTGWDPVRFGIPSDLAARMDPVVCYSLIAVAEALLASGICDAYEFFNYVHVSELGNSVGGGMGGMSALKNIFNKRFQQADMPSDVLQESFINTTAAWISMLMLSCSGPIKTPVGACATAAESVDVAVDTILSGKAQVMIVGGVDDFCEEGSYEFAKMGATSNTELEVLAGREPQEMCRPMASTRGGFMESQGAGVQVLMTARLAILMGVPIYGVIACSNTAMDKLSRSVPAPGQGVLTTARRGPSQWTNHFSKVSFRRQRRDMELQQLAAWKSHEIEAAIAAAGTRDTGGWLPKEMGLCQQIDMIEKEATQLQSAATKQWFSGWKQLSPGLAPLEAALAQWGLTVDDISVASFHGTGTKANDVNESEVTQLQLEQLGRCKENPVFVVSQKSLTGHPKGAAAAWMLNGALQMLASGIVPGNRNLDDVDSELGKYDLLAFVNRSLHLGPGGVKGVLLKSFGFGQAGAEILVLHPDFLLSTLPDNLFDAYTQKRDERWRRTHVAAGAVLRGKRALVQIKEHAPYTEDQLQSVYLDSSARTRLDPATGSYRFFDQGLKKRNACPDETRLARRPMTGILATLAEQSSRVQGLNDANKPPEAVDVAMEALVHATTSELMSEVDVDVSAPAVGVDMEAIADFRSPSDAFLMRNFTAEEQAYCRTSANPDASLCGTWCAKEAVFKALCSAYSEFNVTGYACSPLIDIEVFRPIVKGGGSLPPSVRVGGRFAEQLKALVGLAADGARIKVSITHTDTMAAAVALVSRASAQK